MNHPFADLLGLHLEASQNGVSQCSIQVTDKLLNPHQVVHGAVLYALADTGMGAALYPSLKQGQLCATIEIKMNYFRAVHAGKIICDTQILNRGKSIANLESSIYSDGILVAKANGNYSIFTPSVHTVISSQ